MAPRKKGARTVPVLEEMPRMLRSAIVKVMAEKDLDWVPACEEVALLVDINSNKFKKAVKREAERTYKSRFMTQLNLARGSIRREGFNDGYEDGYDGGVSAGKRRHQIGYSCKVCGQRIDVVPNSDSHKAIVQYMHDHGWRHSSCHQKQSQ